MILYCCYSCCFVIFFFQARRKKKEDAANAKYEDAMKKAKVLKFVINIKLSRLKLYNFHFTHAACFLVVGEWPDFCTLVLCSCFN